MGAGVNLDREMNTIPHNDDGDAVFTFGVAATDRGSPAQISFTTVSRNTPNHVPQQNILYLAS